VTVTYRVANSGGTAGSYSALLKVDGTAQPEQKVSLEPGTSRLVTITLTASEPGQHRVELGGLTAGFVVESPSGWFPWWIVVATAAGWLLVAGLVFLIVKTRQDASGKSRLTP
jgi:hypothetical protein